MDVWKGRFSQCNKDLRYAIKERDTARAWARYYRHRLYRLLAKHSELEYDRQEWENQFNWAQKRACDAEAENESLKAAAMRHEQEVTGEPIPGCRGCVVWDKYRDASQRLADAIALIKHLWPLREYYRMNEELRRNEKT